MRTLKNMIGRYMMLLTCVLVAAILAVIIFLQIVTEQRQARENAERTLRQIEQLLIQNQEDLREIEKEYSATCLHNAEVIAYIIQNDPSVVESVEELKKLAEYVEVDEIHIFDETGRIYAGTHPQYYDFTFDSGEQMMFFKPMLQDRSLKLVQEITPNTAEEKLMQYSAVWSEDGKFILQVGMEPVNVMKATQKNELSYLFSLFRVNLEAEYYAVDIQSGEIVGSTQLECVGMNVADIGLTLNDFQDGEEGFYATVNGQRAYCVFKKVDSNYIGRVLSIRELYRRIPGITFGLAACLIAIALILSRAVTRYMNRYVVAGVHDVNEKLHRIAQGNLDELIEINSSVEFSELSHYINMMKKSLLDYNTKMSYVLKKTNMYIGVYEYNEHMKRVRFTEYIPHIFALEEEEVQRLSADYKAFQQFINQLRENPVPEEAGVFGRNGQYIKLEEMHENDEIFGVVVDVTEEINKRRKIEEERDNDSLTGLYNRRGLEMKLSELFESPKELKASAMIMIDADNLKIINDTYGHERGDRYLKAIAGMIMDWGDNGTVAARLGGDEFVLFLYDYETEEALLNSIENLESAQEGAEIDLDEDIRVPLRFSVGYSLVKNSSDYQSLLKEADEKMYEHKRLRKRAGTARQKNSNNI